MNNSLVSHYMGMSKFDGSTLLGKFTVNNVMEILNTGNIDWCYEIEREEYVEGQTDYNVIITLYMPGRVMTGTAIGDVEFHKDYRTRVIRKAIGNALVDMYRIVKVETAPITQSQPVAPTNNSQPTTPEVVPPVAPATEKPKNGGFSDEQITRVKKFQTEFQIETNEQFVHYLTSWDKNITTKKQLTPLNVDTFCTWAETFFSMDGM